MLRSIRLPPQVITGAALVCLAIVSALFLREVGKRFPQLEPGYYRGSIRGVFGGADEQRELVVYRAVGSDEIAFTLIQSGWRSQIVKCVVRGGRKSDAEWYLPVTILGPDGQLKLVGRPEGEIEYGGKVFAVDSGAEGTWSLRRIAIPDAAAATGPAESIRLALHLRREIADVEQSLARTEARNAAQREEIKKLSSYIDDAPTLRERASARFAELQSDVEHKRATLQMRRAEANQLDSQIALAQRLTPYGRLVTLAREAFERENRWAESILRAGGIDLPTELVPAAQRAARILDLRREIGAERQRIAALSADEGAAEEDEEGAGNE